MSLLNDASLVFIPSGYKEDKVYSIIPSNGAGDLDFVRGCDATRINPQSLVENTPWNLLTYSEDFTYVDWTKSDVTVSANNTTAPNGTNTADKIVENSSTNAHFIETVRPAIADQVYTLSIHFKKAERNYGVLGAFTNQSKQLFVDLTTGSITNTVGTFLSTSVEPLSNGWFRVAATFTATSIIYPFFAISNNGTNISYTGNGSSGIYAWGAQLNIGSTAKPYFPTTDRLNVPRLDYTNSTCPSLLLEKQSTNIALYSEQFDNGAWGNEDITVSANSVISPDGTQNADKLIANTNNSDHSIYTATLGSSSPHTISVYAKAGEYNYIFLGKNNNFATDGAFFNLSNGTISQNTSGLTASIIDAGNGWYRCILSSGSSNWTTPYGIICLSQNGTSLIFAGDNSKGIYTWGFQAEASSYPTSYIPTTSATATRLADSCSKTGISSLIGQTEGTMFIEVTDIAKREQGRYLFLSDATFTNRIVIYQGSGNLNVYCSAGSTFNLTYSLPSGRSKIAFGYKSGLYSLFVNGVERATNTLSAVPSNLSAFGIGSSEGSIGTPEPLDSSVSQALLFKRRLTNTELEKLTTL